MSEKERAEIILRCDVVINALDSVEEAMHERISQLRKAALELKKRALEELTALEKSSPLPSVSTRTTKEAPPHDEHQTTENIPRREI